METKDLCSFIDGVIEGAYQKGLFPKEGVQQVLNIAEFIKQKLAQGDMLVNENTDLKVRIETLEIENKSLKERFESLGIDLEEIKKPVDPTEIEVNEKTVEEVSNHLPKLEKAKK